LKITNKKKTGGDKRREDRDTKNARNKGSNKGNNQREKKKFTKGHAFYRRKTVQVRKRVAGEN